MKIILILLLIASCTTNNKNSKIAAKRINAFVDEYSAEYQFPENKDKTFIDAYKIYLRSVFDVLETHKNPKYFETYISDLRNESEIISNAKFNLLNRHKREHIRTPYPAYEKKMTGELFARLEKTRIDKIKKDLKIEVFSDLESNNQKFEGKFPL